MLSRAAQESARLVEEMNKQSCVPRKGKESDWVISKRCRLFQNGELTPEEWGGLSANYFLAVSSRHAILLPAPNMRVSLQWPYYYDCLTTT